MDDTPVEDLDVAGVRSLLLGEKGYICGKESVHILGPACALTSSSLLFSIPILLPSCTVLMKWSKHAQNSHDLRLNVGPRWT